MKSFLFVSAFLVLTGQVFAEGSGPGKGARGGGSLAEVTLVRCPELHGQKARSAAASALDLAKTADFPEESKELMIGDELNQMLASLAQHDAENAKAIRDILATTTVCGYPHLIAADPTTGTANPDGIEKTTEFSLSSLTVAVDLTRFAIISPEHRSAALLFVIMKSRFGQSPQAVERFVQILKNPAPSGAEVETAKQLLKK